MTKNKSEIQAERFECVWDALCSTPQEANEMCARSDLMIALTDIVRKGAWKPLEAARECGLPLPRMKLFLKRDFNAFSLGDLLDIAASLGYRPIVQLQKRQPA